MDDEKIPAVLALEVKNLPWLDGGIPAAVIDSELRKAIADCLARPGDATARVVSVAFSVKPQADERGNCEAVRFAMDVSQRQPRRKTKEYALGMVTDGGRVGAWFRTDSPTNQRQMTFLDLQQAAAQAENSEVSHED